MKKIYYLTISLAFATMVGCQNENDALNVQDEVSNMAFTASFESNDSRTALQGDNNNVVWVEGDRLSVFAGKTVNKPYILDGGKGTNYGKFTFDELSAGTSTNTSSTAELSANVAYYPYCQDVTVSESGGSFTFNATFPVKQIYSESGTFGNGASPMVAVTASKLDDELMFKNVGGIFRLQLQDAANVSTPTTISKIVFSAEGQNLAGQYQVTTSYNTTNQTLNVTEGSSTIILDCGEGVQLSSSTPTNFVVAMLPVSNVSGGLTIIIYDTTGKKQTYVHNENGTFTLERSGAKSTSLVTYNGTETAITNEANLKAALNAATSGSAKNIVVEGDIILEEPLSIESGNNVNLDLNGYTLTLGTSSSMTSLGGSASEYGITNNGTLTITNGTIQDNTNFYVIKNVESGVLTLDDVVIEAAKSGIGNLGEATINCTITSSDGNAIRNEGTGELTIDGGTYKATGKNRATIYGGYDATDSAWKLTINGGTFESTQHTCLSLNNNLYNLSVTAVPAQLNAGTFKGAMYDLYIGCATVNYTDKCVFENKKVIVRYSEYGKSKVNNLEIPQDGFLIMTETQMADAVSKGDTHVLGSNLTLENALEINKDVVVDLAGYTLTAKGSKTTTIYSGYDVPGNITVGKNVKATFKNGNIVGEKTAILNDKGILTIENVNITSVGTAVYVANNEDWDNWYGVKNVSDPTVTATISNSTLNSHQHGIKTLGYTGVTLDDVTATADKNALSLESCVASIDGGTFEGKDYGLHVYVTKVTTTNNPTIKGSTYKYYVQICDETDSSHSTKYSSMIDLNEWTDLTNANSGHGFLVENDK